MMSKCDPFACPVGRVEGCSNIHVERFYTTESVKYAGKYVYRRASHVYDISCYETAKVREYSVV